MWLEKFSKLEKKLPKEKINVCDLKRRILPLVSDFQDSTAQILQQYYHKYYYISTTTNTTT